MHKCFCLHLSINKKTKRKAPASVRVVRESSSTSVLFPESCRRLKIREYVFWERLVVKLISESRAGCQQLINPGSCFPSNTQLTINYVKDVVKPDYRNCNPALHQETQSDRPVWRVEPVSLLIFSPLQRVLLTNFQFLNFCILFYALRVFLRVLFFKSFV